MKMINLLPKTEQRELKLLTFADQLILFWIWVIVSLIFFVGLTYTAEIYLNGQVTETESEIALKKQALKSSDNEALKQQVEAINTQLVSIKNIQGQHYYWSQAFLELANFLPPDIVVDSLTADRATGKVVIEGVAGNRESVLKFWANMHRSEFFNKIDFPLANLNAAIDDPFTFSFFIVPDKLRNP